MKQWIALLLCLLLVLPLNVYADGTENQTQENQPQTQSENQTGNENPGQSGSENPGQSGSENPGQSGGENPGQSGGENPGQSGDENPGQSGGENPGQSGGENPGQSGSENPGQSGSENPGQSGSQTPGNHTHVWDVSYTIPATCLQEGATGYGCSACGAISVEVLPKLTTHTYDNSCDPHCNVCDLNREVTHKFSSQWTRKAAGHWHACSVCGEKGDFGKHYPGPAATEEKAQICLTCGYTLTAKLGHTHKYETQYTSDATGHWYACSSCDDQKDFEEHSYDDGCDPDCNVCGYLTATAHTYSGTWLSDETGHWDVCTICQEKSPVEPHIPGAEATETDAQLCTACSFELAPALVPTEHMHEGEGVWLTDDENHWKTCSCGEETEKQPHSWDAGEEQEDTTILYTCEDCGITRTEGEPREEGGISPLVWAGAGAAVLLAAAALIAFLLIPKRNKAGKFGK